ncbi:MAG: hypothetical protein JO250_12750, partial [Armatimonadetes bacterium]|nr:hypothetical protein [Armatimonadota bacterium]
PVVMAIVTVWGKDSPGGLLEEKGAWIHRFWREALADIPDIGGCRLLWNEMFFAVPNMGIEEAVPRFARLLRSIRESALESLCVLSPVTGTPQEKLVVLDGVGHEALPKNLGNSSACWHTGSKFYHLRDGEPLPSARADLKQMESIA